MNVKKKKGAVEYRDIELARKEVEFNRLREKFLQSDAERTSQSV